MTSSAAQATKTQSFGQVLRRRCRPVARIGVNQTCGFFTRGDIIDGEDFLASSAVINQTAVFLSRYGKWLRPMQVLAFRDKDTQSPIQMQVRKPGHGFLYG